MKFNKYKIVPMLFKTEGVIMSSMPNHQIVSSTLLRKSLENIAKVELDYRNRLLEKRDRLNSQWFTLDPREPYVIFDK